MPQDNWVLELWTPCLVKALSLLVQCRDLPHGEARWKSPWEDLPCLQYDETPSCQPPASLGEVKPQLEGAQTASSLSTDGTFLSIDWDNRRFLEPP